MCYYRNMSLEFLELEFIDSITSILKRTRALENEYLAKFSLTCFHTRYLNYLYLNKQMTMAALTERIGVDKANTTRAVKDLINKGYIEKVGNGERRYMLKLSEAGEAVAKELKKHIKETINKALKDFSQEEVNNLQKLTHKFMIGVRDAGN